MTDKLREHITFTIIGLVLAGLGTIGSLSVSYLFNSFNKFDSDLRKEKYDFDEFRAKSERGSAFLKLVLSAEDRALARMKRLPANLNSASLRVIYQSGLDGAMDDLANLSGYSAENTGLTTKLHESVQSMFKTEVEYWRSIGRIAESRETGRGISRAELDDVRARLEDNRFAYKVFKSTYDDAVTSQSLQAEVYRHRTDELGEEIKHERFYIGLANVGLFLSIVGFYFMLRLAILGKKPVTADDNIAFGKFE